MIEPYTYEHSIRRYRFASSPSEAEADGHGRGYDGADETLVSSRESFALSPASSADARPPLRKAKRRASHFSLRSLSKSFSWKRSHLGLRKWANSVYRETKRKIKKHSETEGRGHSAGKAQRRKSKAAETESPKINGALSTGSRHKKRDWWKEGVAKYHVSKWTKL